MRFDPFDMNTSHNYKLAVVVPLVAICTFIPFRTKAQGSFQNLDFESANPGTLTPNPTGPPYALNVPVANALPSWSVYYGDIQQTVVNVNDPSLGAAAVALIGPQDNPIDGNYSVLLQPGGSVNYISASIAQDGTIPVGTETLLFRAWQPMSALPFSVSFAGNSLSPVEISSGQSPLGQGYNVYAAAIGAFAGQNGQLEFTVNGENYNSVLLDDIAFSPNTVPEPRTLALLVMGGVALAVRRWRAKAS